MVNINSIKVISSFGSPQFGKPKRENATIIASPIEFAALMWHGSLKDFTHAWG